MNKPFIVIAVFATLLFACKNTTTPGTLDNVLEKAPGLNAGVGNFTVKTPVGWTRKDTSLSGIKVLFLYPPATSTQSFHPNINVISEAMGGYDFDQYVAKNSEGMKQYLQNFKVIETGDITAGGINGKWMHYTQTQNGMDLENIYYMFPKDGISYGLTSTTLNGGMDKYRTAFESIVKTLEIK